jgi:hypothetical protein
MYFKNVVKIKNIVEITHCLYYYREAGWLIDWCLTPILAVFLLYRGESDVADLIIQVYWSFLNWSKAVLVFLLFN